MEILLYFLGGIFLTASASICRVCIDEPIIFTEDETIGKIVQAFILVAPNAISNCTQTENDVDCQEGCLSVDFYDRNETNEYIGSLHYCDLGEEYYVNENARYHTCLGHRCNAQVPVSKFVYIAEDLFIAVMVILVSLAGVLICLIFYKARKHRRQMEDQRVHYVPQLFPETPVRIQLDDLENELDYMEVNNESILI